MAKQYSNVGTRDGVEFLCFQEGRVLDQRRWFANRRRRLRRGKRVSEGDVYALRLVNGAVGFFRVVVDTFESGQVVNKVVFLFLELNGLGVLGGRYVRSRRLHLDWTVE